MATQTRAEMPEASSSTQEGQPSSGGWSRSKLIGLVLGPLLAAIVYALLPEMPMALGGGAAALSANGSVVAAGTAWLAVWWATEAIPIPATSLLPLVLFPVLLDGVAVGDVAPSYGSDTIFLFMGGFMLALAMQKWDLHKRIALTIVSKVGSNTAGLVGGFMLATGFISMCVSRSEEHTSELHSRF